MEPSLLPQSMAELEDDARREGEKVSRALLTRTIRSWVNQVDWPSHVEDEEGGAPYTLKRWPFLSLNTSCGVVEIRVPSYEKVGKRSLRPVEAALGLRASVTPHLEKLTAILATELAFKKASAHLEELLHVELSRDTISRISYELGETAREVEDSPEIPEGFGELEKVEVQADGGRVNTLEGWREPRIARIKLTSKEGLTLTFLLTGIITCDVLWERIAAALKRLGADTCQKLAFVSDGADWILFEAGRRYPHALLILDFYHVVKKLNEVGGTIFGTGSDAARAWVRRYKKRLRRSQVASVIHSLKCCRGHAKQSGPEALDGLNKLIVYLEKREDQLKYLTFKRRGFPIGSGMIEGTIKQVINLRLKRNATPWATENAERFLALRAAKLYGQLDRVCSRKLQARGAKIPPQFRNLLESAPPLTHVAASVQSSSSAA